MKFKPLLIALACCLASHVAGAVSPDAQSAMQEHVHGRILNDPNRPGKADESMAGSHDPGTHGRYAPDPRRDRQQQGQGQGQAQSNRNRVDAGNHNGNVRNAGNNTGTSSSSAHQTNTTTASGNTTTTNTSVAGDTYVQQAPQRNPVASAIAPPLAAGVDSCMGSTSVGAQGVGLGVSIGNTWTDNNCVMLKNSTILWNMGKYDAAIALMCSNEKVREALELSGTECPQTRRERERRHDSPAKASWDVDDPYIAARMRGSQER